MPDELVEPLEPGGASPAGRSQHTAVYDPPHDPRMVVFGGNADHWPFELGDTWILSWGLSATPVVTCRWNGVGIPGGTAQFSATVQSQTLAQLQYVARLEFVGTNLARSSSTSRPDRSGPAASPGIR